MNRIPKTDNRYSVLLEIPEKHLLFNCERASATYTYVHFTKGHFAISKTEYYNVIRYIMYKNGTPMDETRYLCF
jgi:hypothetical protein